MANKAKKNILNKFDNSKKIDPIYENLKKEMGLFKKNIKIFTYIMIAFILVVWGLFFKINGLSASFGAFVVYSMLFVLGGTFLFIIFSLLSSRKLNGKIKNFQKEIPLISIDDFRTMKAGGLVDKKYDYVPIFRLINQGWIMVNVPYKSNQREDYKQLVQDIESIGNLLHKK
jgi:hypothetical protein